MLKDLTPKNVKNILNSIDFNDGFKWGNILYVQIWMIKESNFLILLFKLLVKYFLWGKYNLKYKSDGNNEILIVNTNDRLDHKVLVEKVSSSIEGKNDLLEVNFLGKTNIKNFMRLKELYLMTKKLTKFFTIGESLILSLLVMEQRLICQDILHSITQKRYRLLITFCDVYGLENLITQYFQSKKVKTATLQHGLYDYYPENHIFSSKYKNFESDYIFLWGESTKEIFLKGGVEESRLLVVGNPKYTEIIEDSSMKEYRIFGVILNSPTFNRLENKRLIHMANSISQSLNLQYVIKLHPDDSFHYYKKDINFHYFSELINPLTSIYQYCNAVDFSILGVTTMYLELNKLRSPVFRFTPINNTYGLDLAQNNIFNDSFESLNDFHRVYNTYKNNKPLWYKKMTEFSDYYFTSGDVKQNYNMAIEKIMHQDF